MKEPVLRLRRQDTEVLLVGMIHVAPRPFHENATAMITERIALGSTVVYEDLDGINARFSELIGPPFEYVFKMKEMAFSILREEFGLWYQTDVIPPQSNWINGDDIPTLVEFHARDGWPAAIEKRASRFEAILHNPTAWVERWRVAADREPMEYTPEVKGLRPLGYRDHEAARRINLAAERNNVVSYWGSAHLAGIYSHLIPYGFSLVEQTQRTFDPKS